MELVTVQDAARRVGVTDKSIYYSLRVGKLTAHYQYGKILIDAQEVARYRPRDHPHRLREESQMQSSPTGCGKFAGILSPVDVFLKEKHAEKARER